LLRLFGVMKPSVLLLGIAKRRLPAQPAPAAEQRAAEAADRWPMAFAFVLWCAVSALAWLLLAQLVYALI
jgi:hypothetical protein